MIIERNEANRPSVTTSVFSILPRKNRVNGQRIKRERTFRRYQVASFNGKPRLVKKGE